VEVAHQVFAPVAGADAGDLGIHGHGRMVSLSVTVFHGVGCLVELIDELLKLLRRQVAVPSAPVKLIF
jgi:hypothetical protein